jgi:PAS domain S-box-containing protein
MRLWPSSLRGRLVCSFLVLSVSIVCLAGYIALVQAQGALRDEVFQRLQAVSLSKEARLTSWVNAQSQDLLLLSKTPEVLRAARHISWDQPGSPGHEAALETLAIRFLTVLETNPDLGEIFFISPNGGRTILSTSSDRETVFHSNAEYYLRGKEGFFVQKVYPSIVTSRPAMTASVPLRGRDGALFGVLAAHLDLSKVDRIIDEHPDQGRSGETYLVDRYNVLVSSERFGSEVFPRGVHSVGIDAAIRGLGGSGEYRDHKGTPVLGVYRWMEQFGVGLITEVPSMEAYAPARRLAWSILLLGLLSTMALAVGVFVIARQITGPILAIAQTAVRVAEGDLSQKADVGGDDEVGTLARTFNAMTAQLESLYRSLERKIDDLERTKGALFRSEERYRSLVEGVPDGIAILSGQQIIFMNGAGTKLLRLPRESAAPYPQVGEMAVVNDRELLATAIHEVSNTGEARDLELSLLRHDGTTMECELNIMPFESRTLQILFRDVTERKRDERERRRLEEELRQTQKMEAVGVLAGGIAHDFNNLLQAMGGYIQLLQGGGSLSRLQEKYLGELSYSAERATELVQRLLAFSRKVKMNARPMDLNATILTTMRLLERTIPKMIRIRTSLQEGIPQVLADPIQVEQIVMNLCSNAVDAIPGQGQLTVSTGCLGNRESAEIPELAPGRHVFLRIEDSGVGMDKEVMKRMYEPFFTTKEVGKGTGLGLATVYGIVTDSKGHIACISLQGQGTVFTVYLPAVDSDQPSAGPVCAPAKEALRGGSETILMVDDEERILEIGTDILGQYGYRILTASSGEHALETLGNGDGPVDLVILDLGMPGMGGELCLQEISRTRPGLKVIVASGYSGHKIRSNPKEFGAAAFLHKPYRLESLLSLVRSVLDE